MSDESPSTRVRRGLAALLLVSAAAAVAGCGGPSTGAPQARVASGSTLAPATSSTPPAPSSSPGAATAAPAATPSGGTAPSGAPAPAGATPSAATPRTTPPPATAAPTAAPKPPAAGWSLTAVYTAVESFHTDTPAEAVTGCPPGADECTNGTTALGSYAPTFLAAVRSQGAGRLTSGRYAGRYLTWDADSGYAIDAAVLDASEAPMRPFVSAGADPSIALGTAFQVLDCGVDRVSGRPVDPGVCARIRAASWVVRAPARQAAGSHALELYIGEEDGPGFAAGPLPVRTVSARTTLG
ncbi:MAG: hypothetical protein QOE72_1749 [Chloroflexota bacterium]|jgi:hypothetical protein|nr:hypothetical protein [Chloroflexota bacterium]